MEFNKCPQCGCFFAYSGKMCPNCAKKDTQKIQKLENYIENYNIPNTLQELSFSTGISEKDLNRYINKDARFSQLNKQFFL
jgi:uncharacterized Zn finger protein (UPF0148 family)